MKKIYLFIAFILLSVSSFAENNSYSWDNNENYLALKNNDNVIWQLNYAKSQGKPYFYPLNTVSGLNLLSVPKAGHTWHTGLFFQWKYIQELTDNNELIGNKNLYWEPDGKGRTECVSKEIKLNKDFSAQLKLKIQYFVADTNPKNIQLYETRIINISAPDENGTYSITWDMTFNSEKNLHFTAEPIEKFKGLGGYAGISARFALNFKNAQTFNILGDEKREIMGKNSPAMAYNLESVDKKKGSMIMIESSKNDRYPASNYSVYARDKGGKFVFLSFADVYRKSRDLKKGDSLKLRYKIIINDNFVDKKAFMQTSAFTKFQ